MPVGEYLGYQMSVNFDSFYQKFTLNLKGAMSHKVEIGTDELGNITRISNALEGMEKSLAKEKETLSNLENQLENAKAEVTKPFPKESELQEKTERLSALNALLNMDEKGGETFLEDGGEPEEPTEKAKKPSIMETLAKYQGESSHSETEHTKQQKIAASL